MTRGVVFPAGQVVSCHGDRSFPATERCRSLLMWDFFDADPEGQSWKGSGSDSGLNQYAPWRRSTEVGVCQAILTSHHNDQEAT